MSKPVCVLKLRLVGVAAVLVAILVQASHGAKERVYTMGDNDPGATIGGMPPNSTELTPNRPATNDIQASTTDFGTSATDPPQVNLSLVPLIVPSVARSPHYVDASDRPGAQPGNLALSFDGVDDVMYNVRPPGLTAYMAFDPRNFAGSFATLSQAWVKPAATNREQFVFRAGNEIGGAMITTPDNVNGLWTLRTGNPSAETPLENVQIVSNVEVVPNVWTHVAVLRGGNQSLLYVNGSLAALTSGFWSVENVAPVVGAADPINGGSFFQGVIDNFNIGTPDGFDPTVELDYFPDSSITFSGVTGDVNQDGVVDVDDYNIWSENVGFDNGFGVGDPSTQLLGDVNRSGRVDLRDFQIINDAALNPPPPGSGAVGEVPEPTSIALLLIGFALVALRRGHSLAVLVTHWRRLALAAVAVMFTSASPAVADLVAADDFLYDGPTKLLHQGGGFNGLQQYRGGQNGPAGGWAGNWGQIGDGIITTPDYTPPIDPFDGMPEPVAPANVALYDGLFGVQSELFRDFSLAGSVSPTQTLYFGGRFQVDLNIGTDGGTVGQFYSPRLFLNRVAGDDRIFDISGVPITPENQRDRSQDIALGIQVAVNLQDPQQNVNTVVARLGADENNMAVEAMTPVTTNPPNNGNFHTVIGKLELNVAGDMGTDERLTVWFDPTGVESGGTMAQLEADILPDLTTLVGTFHSQGSVPVDPVNTELGRSYIDDMAIGTTWQDVAQVVVPRLTLQINSENGSGRIVNNTGAPFQLDGYSIESANGSLDGDGWNSLDEQNVAGWQQNLATDSQLVETYFMGSTTVAAGGQLPLGKLFSVGEMQDVVGRYSTADTLLNVFQVEFVSGGVPGDYNDDGVVNAADYTVWRNHLGQTFQLTNEVTGVSEGIVTIDDYNAWKERFGNSGAGSGASAGPAAAAAVPEPGGLGLILATMLAGALARTQRQERPRR
jgi:Concanavalin A-like lectin/glucanases superfamily/PEP-CTERM motif